MLGIPALQPHLISSEASYFCQKKQTYVYMCQKEPLNNFIVLTKDTFKSNDIKELVL